MMRSAMIVCVLAIATIGSAFRFNAVRPARMNTVRYMSDAEKPKTSIVPVDKENIENAAAVTSGVLGFLLAGPIGGLFLAAVGKYATKKENEAGDVFRGVGKSVVEVYNFFISLNAKYALSDKVTESLSKATSSIDNESFKSFSKSAETAVSKVKEINSEFDLVSKGKQALEVASTLSDTALEKVEELNAKYDFVETSMKAATVAVNKIRDQVQKE